MERRSVPALLPLQDPHLVQRLLSHLASAKLPTSYSFGGHVGMQLKYRSSYQAEHTHTHNTNVQTTATARRVPALHKQEVPGYLIT